MTSKRSVHDATHMSLLYILDQVTMSPEEREITVRVLHEHLNDQDFRTYSTDQLLRYLQDIVHDFKENQEDIDDDSEWEE